MDKITQMEQIIAKIAEQYMASRKDKGITFHFIQDNSKKLYALFEMGFEGRIFFHACIFHVALQNEKVWIYQDTSAEGMAELLLQNGINEKEIVLGYFSPTYREVTDFAVA
ncbi:MAG: XisI protein [Saprospiraceae bacterium]|nr:XisI protein [Saprospiraceae bacterium]